MGFLAEKSNLRPIKYLVDKMFTCLFLLGNFGYKNLIFRLDYKFWKNCLLLSTELCP